MALLRIPEQDRTLTEPADVTAYLAARGKVSAEIDVDAEAK